MDKEMAHKRAGELGSGVAVSSRADGEWFVYRVQGQLLNSEQVIESRDTGAFFVVVEPAEQAIAAD